MCRIREDLLSHQFLPYFMTSTESVLVSGVFSSFVPFFFLSGGKGDLASGTFLCYDLLTIAFQCTRKNASLNASCYYFCIYLFSLEFILIITHYPRVAKNVALFLSEILHLVCKVVFNLQIGLHTYR